MMLAFSLSGALCNYLTNNLKAIENNCWTGNIRKRVYTLSSLMVHYFFCSIKAAPAMCVSYRLQNIREEKAALMGDFPSLLWIFLDRLANCCCFSDPHRLDCLKSLPAHVIIMYLRLLTEWIMTFRISLLSNDFKCASDGLLSAMIAFEWHLEVLKVKRWK